MWSLLGTLIGGISGVVGKILPDRSQQNEAQSRINEAEVSGGPASLLRLWRSFLGWMLTLLFGWEVAGRLIIVPLLFPAWQSLADHFLPTRCRLNPQTDATEEGPMLNRGLVDATGILAMRTLAAGLQGGLTSPARPWFRLSLDDVELARSRAGQAWLDEVATRMRSVFQRSNFYNAMHTLYGELGTFGTAFVFELADPVHGFRFIPLCAGEYALDCDAARRVDTVFRRSAMTLRQISQAFGPEAMPDTLREAARRNPEERRNVIQAVYPRENERLSQQDPVRMS